MDIAGAYQAGQTAAAGGDLAGLAAAAQALQARAPGRPEGHLLAAQHAILSGGDPQPALIRAEAAAQDDFAAWRELARIKFSLGDLAGAGDAWRAAVALDPNPPPAAPRRSFIVPVLDHSPHAPYNIHTLLEDLSAIEGEVILVFNGPQMFDAVQGHPRVTKWCLNQQNAGVARAWNQGLQLAEAEVLFILNADIRISAACVEALEAALHRLPGALMVAPSGEVLNDVMDVAEAVGPEGFDAPKPVDRIDGHLFALHAARLHDAGLSFDPRLAPYFGEELDLALKAAGAGLSVYAVPVPAGSHDHVAGISRNNLPIQFFGRPVRRLDVQIANMERLAARWDKGPRPRR